MSSFSDLRVLHSGRFTTTAEDYNRFNVTAELIGAARRYMVAQVAEPALGRTGGVLSLPHLWDVLEKELR
jgi:hypothetical protein